MSWLPEWNDDDGPVTFKFDSAGPTWANSKPFLSSCAEVNMERLKLCNNLYVDLGSPSKMSELKLPLNFLRFGAALMTCLTNSGSALHMVPDPKSSTFNPVRTGDQPSTGNCGRCDPGWPLIPKECKPLRSRQSSSRINSTAGHPSEESGLLIVDVTPCDVLMFERQLLQ